MPGSWQLFQYQSATDVISTAGEAISEDKWHYSWSLPVRVKIDPRLAIALAASGLFFSPQQLGENIFVDKWFSSWREPVRFKGTFRGMPTAEQPAAFPSPQPFVSFGWFDKLNDPIVKTKARLTTAAQVAVFPSPLPFVSFSWFRAQTELPPKPKIGLSARFQQFLAQPPRVLPTPTITGTLNAIETGDSMLFAGTSFGRPVNAMIGVIELERVPYLSIIEMPLSQGVRGVIEDHVAPASGSPATVITTAAVSIRII